MEHDINARLRRDHAPGPRDDAGPQDAAHRRSTIPAVRGGRAPSARRRKGIAAVAAATAVGTLLLTALPLGMFDIVVYRLDPRLGYVPIPDQHGAFLGMFDYAINGRSMAAAAAWDPAIHPALLLLGDSVVLGGRLMRQSQRLGAAVETALSGAARIWPVGAASWGLRNQLAYLERNRDVLHAVDGLVLLLNSGDFGPTSCWVSARAQPLRPLRGPGGLADMLLPSREGEICPEQADDGTDIGEAFRRTLAGYRKPVVVVAYPKRDELQGGRLAARIERLRGAPRLRVVDLARHPRWTAALYKDEIHPTVDGYRVLAEIIAEHLRPLAPRARWRR